MIPKIEKFPFADMGHEDDSRTGVLKYFEDCLVEENLAIHRDLRCVEDSRAHLPWIWRGEISYFFSALDPEGLTFYRYDL